MKHAADRHTAELPGLDTPRRRGRPSLGARPMTPAERKRRSRQNAGTTSLELDHAFVKWLRRQAQQQGVSVGELLMARFGVK
ncbi:hypothetical protein GCM10007860_02240 [Chitiniphilus shinanonensis]|uniref:Uncharacterized protein n=1 Tax=Chitiniphilus shinanonensis TaxID=553088 RepID=A0ABQ6BMH5_9NEIS|nr:hypothetical protein [Chitiniphilus shinanonensis]GLS03081.1 hypothetical protein GCM10007860_02240 [Chitiniphilus shinanonensis]